jgi:ABC-type Zn uptake system ZnuABC Zn-binding protein ZnuA
MNEKAGAHTLPRALLSLAALLALTLAVPRPAAAKKLKVVATIPTYGAIARVIVGQRGQVRSLARGYEDPHFVRPKPSLALALEGADLLVSTGLDLELWLPALMDKANNPRIRSGQPGFVSASEGIRLLEKPAIVSRNEGGVHIYGNPHIYTGPLNGKIIARNIMVGLKKVDPAGAAVYEQNYKRFRERVDRRLFGDKLPKILGSTLLTKLTLAGKLIPFLEGRSFRGKKLSSYLGGWLKQALPLRGKKIVAYHKNWAYFVQVFGVEIVDFVEPKPGIPPSPGHVARVIDKMKKQHVKVLLAANYYDSGKVKSIASRVGARPVIVALAVGGEPEVTDFFSQYDVIIGRLLRAFAAQGS